MKKKKLSLIGVIILAALYLLFGLGPDVPPAAEPALPTETVTATIQEIYETVTDPTTAGSKDATDPYSGETEAPIPNETEAPPPETTEAAIRLAKEFGIMESGGSDFHGENKPDIQLGIGRGDLCVPAILMDKLLEG